MTDLEKLKNTLIEIKCNFKVKTTMSEHSVDTKEIGDLGEKLAYDTHIKIDEGVGYSCFVCEFYFLNGKFQTHGCWE